MTQDGIINFHEVQQLDLFLKPQDCADSAPEALTRKIQDPNNPESFAQVLIEDVPIIDRMGRVFIPFFNNVTRRLLQKYPYLPRVSRDVKKIFVPCVSRSCPESSLPTNPKLPKNSSLVNTGKLSASIPSKRLKGMTWELFITEHRSKFIKWLSDLMPPCSLRVTCSTPEGYSSKEPLSFSVLILTSKMVNSLQPEFNLYPKPTRTNIREFINSFPFMSSMIVEHTQSTLSSAKTKFMRDTKTVTFTPSIFCEEDVGSSSSFLTLTIEKVELIEIAANELRIIRTPFQFVEDHQSTLFQYFQSQIVKMYLWILIP